MLRKRSKIAKPLGGRSGTIEYGNDALTVETKTRRKTKSESRSEEIVLGLFAEGPNPAACIIQGGKLLAFVEEERLVRERLARGRYPALSVDYCLKTAGISQSEVSEIAFGWDARKYTGSGLSFMQRFYGTLGRRFSKDCVTLANEREILTRFSPDSILSNLRNMLATIGGDPNTIPPVRWVGHHLSHAASAFFASGFTTAAVLTIDGSGEELAVALWRGTGTKLSLVRRVPLPHSLGWFYASICEYLGFRPYLDEGKVMALAAYGKSSERSSRLIDAVCRRSPRVKHGYVVDPTYIFYGGHRSGLRFTDRLAAEFGPPGELGAVPSQEQANIALALQVRLEEVILDLVRNWIPPLGERNLCLAGGVALNCKMNGALTACQKEGVFDELFIQPISNDAGTALGAAMMACISRGLDPRFHMSNTYMGPEYSAAAVRGALERFGLTYSVTRDPAMLAARLICRGKIVGWFQGRAEAGPRGLGARSILADARSKTSHNQVNSKVKHREPWRPFAPTILQECAAEYLEDPTLAPFMIRSFRVKRGQESKIPSVVHVDGSTRPQILSKSEETPLRRLIQEVKRITGIGVVLNTSFNGPDEPIVCSPEDAVRTYLSSDLDALVIGECIVVRDDGRR